MNWDTALFVVVKCKIIVYMYKGKVFTEPYTFTCESGS